MAELDYMAFAPWKFLLDFSIKGAIESNAHVIKLFSHKEKVIEVYHNDANSWKTL